VVVHFEPGSTGRVYRFQYAHELTGTNVWQDVPGAGPRMGMGGTDALSDTNMPPRGIHYRIGVQQP